MKEDILKLIKDKKLPTTEFGENLYSNITDKDLNKIIEASIMLVVDKIQEKINEASDEWDTINLIENELSEIKAKLNLSTKKIKPN